MPAARGPALAWAALIFLAFAALYVGISPSLAYQPWDSLEYSYACELRGPLATWGNHPLGQLLQCGAFEAARLAGYTGRALPVLKIVSGVTGAGAVAVFFLLLARTLRVKLLPALGWSVVLGGAFGLWQYAGTADIYAISLFALVVAWRRVLDDVAEQRTNSAASVAALSVASLVHQYNFVMLACGMTGLALFGSAAMRRRLLNLAVSTTVVCGVAFTILGALSLPTHSPLRLVKWIVGYGGDPTYGRSFGLRGLPPALHSVVETFLRDPYLPGPRGVWSAVALAGIVLFLAGLVRLRRLPPAQRPLLAATSLQLLVGWSLIVWWWPLMYGKWWILTLPMIVIWWNRTLDGLMADLALRTPGLARWLAWPALAAPLVTGAFLLAFNFVVVLDNERRPDVTFERSLAEWVARSAPDDLLIENGRLTAHLLFWSNRPNAMNVYRVLQVGYRTGDSLGAVRQMIDTAIRDGHQVLFGGNLDPYFFTDDILGLVGTNRQELERCFEAYRRDGPVFSYQEWPTSPPTPVFRLQLPSSRP